MQRRPWQPVTGPAITQTIDAPADINIIKQFISFAITQQITEANKVDFFNVANVPGVIGVIDGTHIRLVACQPSPKALLWRQNN